MLLPWQVKLGPVRLRRRSEKDEPEEKAIKTATQAAKGFIYKQPHTGWQGLAKTTNVQQRLQRSMSVQRLMLAQRTEASHMAATKGSVGCHSDTQVLVTGFNLRVSI